ncbi:PREDICTED: replication factor C subunit 5 [Nicrophorus vespilloides]|uniref:Replication factor C subunit 5 n=1 Tax=Nicrophorus vespilloides TaxID=110193 RepID=A0ABM1MTN1_NICVS|nr:PREDICTED: replication factor C subunit 5 [Nicrophorus vespilloides]
MAVVNSWKSMSYDENRPNLPWVEKYRPNTLEDFYNLDDIVTTLKKFIDEGQLPHLLFYGPPGTGKTSLILACARKLYTPAQFNSMVLELNASDDRGIGIVRGQILTFASTRTIFKSGFKLIVLDEADAMTMDAQNALRRIIEKYTENVRFCIICNYLSKIIPALQSRCTRFRFGPVPNLDMAPVIHMVAEMEKLDVHHLGMDSIVQLSKGDLRKALNVLQSTSMSYDKITEENVYLCVGHPRPADIQYVIETILSKDFKTSYEKIREMQTVKGFALQDILSEALKYIYRIEFPFDFLIELWEAMAEIEFRLAAGSNEHMQLTAFISALQRGKSIVPPTDI